MKDYSREPLQAVDEAHDLIRLDQSMMSHSIRGTERPGASPWWSRGGSTSVGNQRMPFAGTKRLHTVKRGQPDCCDRGAVEM